MVASIPVRTLQLCMVVVALATPRLLEAAPQYHFTSLGTLNGSAVPTAINENGKIVGYSYINGNTTHAFLYSVGTMNDLGTLPGGLQSTATGINDLGQVVGYSISNVGSYIGLHTGFTYSNGVMQPLGNLPGKTESTPNGINQAGHIVGNSGTNPTYNGFFFADGTFTDLGFYKPNAINNSDESVGTMIASTGWQHASLYKGGIVTDLGTLGGKSSYANGITDNGKVVGSAQVGTYASPGRLHAFIYENSTMTDLGTLRDTAYDYSQGLGINSVGTVVGYASVDGSSGFPHAFVYQDGTIYDLNDLVDDSQGWLLQQANAINDKGWIAGYATDPLGRHSVAFLLTPIPAPSSVILGAIGLMVFVGRKLMRRSK